MNADQIAYIQAHYNVDQTGDKIADHLGINRKSLTRIVMDLRQKGYAIKWRILDHRRVAIVLCNYATMHIQDLADLLGMSRQSAKSWIDYLRTIGIVVPSGALKLSTNKCKHLLQPSRNFKEPGRKPTSLSSRTINNHINPDVVKIKKPTEEYLTIRVDHKTWKQVPLSRL